MRRTCISLMVAVFLVASVNGPAFAGDKQRHRWEGVAIGVGAAILGHAVVKNLRDEAPAQVTPIHKEGRHHRPRAHHDHGRKGRKVWIPPVYERVWNPGHYNRHGNWVAGRWITIETQPGHWAKKARRRACR